ncbi:MAG: glycerol-3-phosphate acyltransferase, partial [Hyphomicrobiales bacterium]
MDGAFEAPATWVELIAAFIVGYALGSIPFGIVLTRLAGGPDLRSIGSGNIGATNVLRTGRKGLAAATLVGDMLKGTLAVLIAKWLLTTPSAGWWQAPPPALAAACGAFLGHLFPIWLGFKG